MRSSRRQVKTPVGNKTKRGAELEGTPKTPASLEFNSPVRSSANTVDVSPFSQQQRPGSSARPLHRNRAQQGFATENPSTGLEQQTPRESTTTAHHHQLALSPLCLNADLYHHQQGQRTSVKKNSIPFATTQLFSKERPLAPQNQVERDGQGEINDKEGGTEQGPDEGKQEGFPPSKDSCRPSMFPSGCNRVMIWNNAAFSSELVHDPGGCENMASSSSFLSSTNSHGGHEAGLGDQTEKRVARRLVLLESSASRSPPLTAAICVGEGAQVVLEEDNGQAADNVSAILSEVEKDRGTNDQTMKEATGSGLEEIEVEIQKLTQRLKELQVEKRRRYEAMSRQGKGEAVKCGRAGDGLRKVAGTKGASRMVAAKFLSRTATPGPTQQRRGNGSSSTPNVSELRRSVSACTPRRRRLSASAPEKKKLATFRSGYPSSSGVVTPPTRTPTSEARPRTVKSAEKPSFTMVGRKNPLSCVLPATVWRSTWWSEDLDHQRALLNHPRGHFSRSP